MADTSAIELHQIVDTQIPGTLIFKNLKINCSDEEYIANNNNDKNQESINQIISKNRSFIKSFQQQTLRGWYFTPTIKGSLLCTCFCWVTLLTLGIINLAVTSSLIENIYDYPADCQNSTICILKMNFPDDIEGPVFLYYGIKYYYQNHRDYVKSISWDQIRGLQVSSSDLSSKCSAVQTMGDVTSEEAYTYSGHLIDSDQIASPCGLIAKSLFNDTYVLNNSNNTIINIETNNIVFSSYKENAFKRDPNYHKTQYIDVQDERFIVWTQFSTTSYWYKLWGRIPETIRKGEYYLTIFNNYNVSKFSGIKSINFSNSSLFGGKNRLLGGFLIFFGGLYFSGFLYILKNRNNFVNESNLNFDWKK